MISAKKLLTYSIGLLAVQPWSLANAFEAGATIPRPDYQLPQLPPLQSTPDTDLQQKAPAASTDTGGSNLRFILKTVVFDGVHALSEEKLQAVAAPLIGKAITRSDLDTLRLQLLETYKEAGFIYPSVILPSQHISAGSVHYQINESRLTQINVKGTERLHPEYVQNRLALNPDEPVKRGELQERFQNLLTDPLIERVNGILRPGTNPGDTVLDLDVKRAKPYELHLGMDNGTTPFVGSYTGRLDGIVRNLTGWGDFLRVNLSGSAGTKTIGGYFSMPLNAYDTRLNIGYQGNESNVVDSRWEPHNVESGFMDLNFGLSHPVYRTQNRVFSLEGQFAFRQTNTSFAGDPFFLGEACNDKKNPETPLSGLTSLPPSDCSKAKVSVLRFIQNYIDRDAERVITLRSTMNVGVDFFNATINPDGIADGRYFSWIGQMRYLRKLDERGTQLFFRGDIQLANESLLPLERFALGGMSTVRGYRQNELVRDEGYAVSLELRYPIFTEQKTGGHRFNIVPFFDLGGVSSDAHRLSQNAAAPNQFSQSSKTLMSTGLGFQWSWQQLDAEFYWARALSSLDKGSRGDSDIQDSGIHFRLHARIL